MELEHLGLDAEDIGLASRHIIEIENMREELATDVEQRSKLPENASPVAWEALQNEARREYFRAMADGYNDILGNLSAEMGLALKHLIRGEALG